MDETSIPKENNNQEAKEDVVKLTEEQFLNTIKNLSDPLYRLIDDICKNDNWNDEKIVEIDGLLSIIKNSESVRERLKACSEILKLINLEIIEKRGHFSFADRKVIMICGSVYHKLVVEYEKQNGSSSA